MDNALFLAKPEDGKQISQILESTAGNGMVVMSYTRRPDAYLSYQKESGTPLVYVQRQDQQIIQTCAMLVRKNYIGRAIKTTGYICGLKKISNYSGYAMNTFKIFNCFDDEKLDLTYCCVLKSNDSFRQMIEKNRRILSSAKICEFRTFMFNPSQRIKAPKHQFTFRQATSNDLNNLIAYLNEEGKKHDLFPVIESLDQFSNLSVEDFYLLLDNDQIICAAALWDVSSYKQYTVKKYSWFMKVLRGFNPLLSALKYIKLPKVDEPIIFPFISFLVCKDNNLDHYQIFLKEIAKVASRKYGLAGIALATNHFAYQFMKTLKSVSFDSNLYKLVFNDHDKNTIISDQIFTENALL